MSLGGELRESQAALGGASEAPIDERAVPDYQKRIDEYLHKHEEKGGRALVRSHGFDDSCSRLRFLCFPS
jgi:hypothetical protein